MKKLYLILLMLLLLFIPTSINAVAVYQLDQPIKELDNYTLRQVFQNRNIAMPDLIGKEAIEPNVFRIYNQNGITIDYNVYNGIWTINGTVTTGFNLILFNIEQNIPYTTTYIAVSGTLTGGSFLIFITSPFTGIINQMNENVNKQATFTTTTQTTFRYDIPLGRTFNNYQFKLQLEYGSVSTPYQLSSSGPYNQFNLGWLDLTEEQIQTYYNLYIEAVRFEHENVQASQDNGGYQNIFKGIINGVKNLMVEMGFVWSWLNAPLITSDMTSYQFNIDWSWDLIGVVRQILNSAGVLTMQILFIVPSLAFSFMGIPVHVSILSLLFSNLIFLLLGWIMVKSFLI